MMGTFHIDRECDAAFIRLNDALCSFERATSRDYTLILVPETPDEKIQMSLSGKPIPSDFDPKETLEAALQRRAANA